MYCILVERCINDTCWSAVINLNDSDNRVYLIKKLIYFRQRIIKFLI